MPDANTVTVPSPETPTEPNSGPVFITKPKPGAPVEQKTEPVGSEPDANDPEPSPGEKQGQPQKRGKPDAETRIKDLSSKNRELELQLARLQGREEGRKPEPSPDKPKTGDLLTEPNIDDFDTYAAYDKANRAYLKQEMNRELTAEFDKREQANKGKTEAETKKQEFSKRFLENKAKIADFDEVMKEATEAGGPPVSRLFAECFTDPDICEKPADLAMYLVKNPEEATKIYDLKTRESVAAAIARIEAREFGEKPAKPLAKTITSAAPPPERVSGTTSVAKDPMEAAIERGDVSAYKRLKQQKLLRERNGA